MEIDQKKTLLIKVKNCFSRQNEPLTAKLSFSGVLKRVCGNLQKNLLRTKKCFSHQYEPHIAKLSFSGVQSIFSEIDKKKHPF